MKTIPAILMACALICATQASAAPRHNLRFYSIVEEQLDFAIDDGAPFRIAPTSITHFTVTPGAHTLKIKTESGLTASIDAVFDETQMAARNGHKTWCVVARARPGEAQIFLDSKAGCQKILEFAEPNDEINQPG